VAESQYLLDLARRDEDGEIRRSVERRFRSGWHDRFEWRIGTETEEAITRTDEGYEVQSTCDLRFVARVQDVEAALTARALFESLHIKLFYGLGWPSWAGYLQMEPDDPPNEPFAADAHPYVKELHGRSIERYGRSIPEIEKLIDSEGTWVDDASQVVKRITVEETYPEIPPEATDAVVPELWFACEVERGVVNVSWRSPTVSRALLFVGIVDALTGDIDTTFGWQ
jgi:hypothetical protein